MQLMRDIFQTAGDMWADPAEYWPLLLLVGLELVVVAGLIVMSFIARRRGCGRKGIPWLAWIALAASLAALASELPLNLEVDGRVHAIHMEWLFVIPALIAGLVLWSNRRRLPPLAEPPRVAMPPAA
jgi:hypothetical protein